MAQMTSGSLYHYFPNKNDLVKATFDEMAEMSIPRVAGVCAKRPGLPRPAHGASSTSARK